MARLKEYVDEEVIAYSIGIGTGITLSTVYNLEISLFLQFLITIPTLVTGSFLIFLFTHERDKPEVKLYYKKPKSKNG